MQISNYLKCLELKEISLENLYSFNKDAISDLDYNLEALITTEAPITLNTIKERFREDVFHIKKISQKALDIILSRIDLLKFYRTDNLFDMTYFPSYEDSFVKFFRINSKRQIYDIPHEELNLLIADLISKGFESDALFREILRILGFEVLTQKAREYLEFCLTKLN